MSTSPIPSGPRLTDAVERSGRPVAHAVPSANSDRSLPLYGRQAEREALDQVVAAVQAGRSAVLVLRGAAGIGKSVLLDHAHGVAAGCRVARTAGVEAESDLTFSGLHRLCAPFLHHLGRLPDPQRDALSRAFGLTAGDTPDRFLMGLAVLNLLAAAGEKEPLICLVDDAQWLDEASARTLAFVARRLPVAAIGLVVAVRDPHLRAELRELPEREVGRLNDGEARALLELVTPGLLEERVLDRMVAEAQGNPRALLVLPLGLTPAELAGGFGRPDLRLVGGDEEGPLRRVRALPAPAQRLLLIAAAEPLGDVGLLSRAAELLGLDLVAAAPAVDAGLITLGTRVLFSHPLVRSAAYHAATPQDRQDVHRALAEATDRTADPGRRAWHLANAVAGPDETVAAELERRAEQVGARAGVAAAAALLERAAELTPDPARRCTRALAAAEAKFRAGGYDAAGELLGAVELGPLDERTQAQVSLLRARIVHAATSPSSALPLLLSVADRLGPLDPGLARAAYRDAFDAALAAGELPDDKRLADLAPAVLALAPETPSGPGDLLLDGTAALAADDDTTGLPMTQRALDTFRTEDLPAGVILDWLPLACRTAHNVWNFDAWTTLSRRLVDVARATGTLSALPGALHLLVSNRALAGELLEADALLAEAVSVGEATGNRGAAQHAALALEPWRGREAATRAVIDAVRGSSALWGAGKADAAAGWASAVLYNGLGRYEEAYVAAERGCEYPAQLGGPFNRSLIELVEAAARSGRPGRAAEAARQLGALARGRGTDWALGLAAGARAQVTSGPESEASYQEAVERLGRTEVRVMLARAHLLYGEWLRLGNRRLDAREQLGTAYEMLSEMGAEAFAERARRGLQATGETIRRRLPQTHTVLTPQESQIARLAGQGLTNPQIGTQLFISPHTVEWHLRKVFQKLGIVSRKQLRGQLVDGAVATA